MGNTHTGIFVHGHRGTRGWRTENSLEGFCYAIEQGAHFVEMDIVLTRDHEIIVSHEPWMNAQICLHPNGERISEEEERQLNIFTFPLIQAQSYRLGELVQDRFPHQQTGSTRKPSLHEVMETLKLCSTNYPNFYGLNIEIKSRQEWDHIYHPEPKQYAEIVLHKLASIDHTFEIIIQTFDHRLLEELHAQQCPYPLVALVETEEEFLFTLERLSFVPWGIGPHHSMIDSKILKQCEALGMEVLTWTVNETDDMLYLLNLGVNHLISDYPDEVVRLAGLHENHGFGKSEEV